jgi:predicted nucleic acid-binding protein
MYLLDTNVISELRKIPVNRADRTVLAWATEERLGSCWLSVITLTEVERGVLLVGRKDPVQAHRIAAWLHQSLEVRFDARILPVTRSLALAAPTCQVPNPMQTEDALLAGTASIAGFTLVTRNTAHFSRTSVKVLNPWLGT